MNANDRDINFGEGPQLTFVVNLHNDLIEHPDPLLTGSIKIKGALPLGIDLNAGDVVTVSIGGPDGTVIASGQATATYPTFRELRDDGKLIGTERVHTAELS